MIVVGDEVEAINHFFDFTGIVVGAFSKIDGEKCIVVEDRRGMLFVARPDEVHIIGRDPVSMTCYGRVHGTAASYTLACEYQERHIRECPQGPMSWATSVYWHRVKDVGWEAASRGEYLSHSILLSRPDPLVASSPGVDGAHGSVSFDSL